VKRHLLAILASPVFPGFLFSAALYGAALYGLASR
jgi:hypothetical protein